MLRHAALHPEDGLPFEQLPQVRIELLSLDREREFMLSAGCG